jgi:hypothetical protein
MERTSHKDWHRREAADAGERVGVEDLVPKMVCGEQLFSESGSSKLLMSGVIGL